MNLNKSNFEIIDEPLLNKIQCKSKRATRNTSSKGAEKRKREGLQIKILKWHNSLASDGTSAQRLNRARAALCDLTRARAGYSLLITFVNYKRKGSFY